MTSLSRQLGVTSRGSIVIHGPSVGGPWIEVDPAGYDLTTQHDSQPLAAQAPTDQDSESPAEAAAVIALAAWLASGSAAVPPAELAARPVALGIPRPALDAAARLVVANPPDTGRTGTGIAARTAARREPLQRARYLLAAARRIATVATTGRGLRGGVQAERQHLARHRAAARARADAAARTDLVAARHQTRRLRWKAVLDNRTDAACRALNGREFDLGDPPNGTYPGALHAACRCTSIPA